MAKIGSGCGRRSGPRPDEAGPDRRPDLTPDPSFDVVADDFLDLADRLGC